MRSWTNSFTLSKEEVQERIDRGDDYVIRINMPLKEDIRFQDEVYGWIVVHSSTLDDKVLLKSDGLPTYHLANVIDDYLMKISHVIRGKEWLPSTPLHVLLYQYLGWEKAMPKFAHLPLLLKPSGKGKLSKRDGLKFGFPVFPMEWMDQDEQGNPVKVMGFRDEGYLPEALLNFLAFLGWNPGTEQEMFSLSELVEAFSIERVAKSDAIFDVDKSKWFNEQYIKALSPQQLAQLALATQGKSPFPELDIPKAKMEAIAELMQARITFPNEIWQEADYFFQMPAEYDAKTLKKKWKDDSREFLISFAQLLDESDKPWQADELKALLEAHLEAKEMKIGKAMPGLRLALTGRGGGPDLMQVMEILGQEESLRRFKVALEKFPVNA
ncbi:MAG: glutamate--tRNA ligase [Bacteroidota bacterium]